MALDKGFNIRGMIEDLCRLVTEIDEANSRLEDICGPLIGHERLPAHGGPAPAPADAPEKMFNFVDAFDWEISRGNAYLTNYRELLSSLEMLVPPVAQAQNTLKGGGGSETAPTGFRRTR